METRANFVLIGAVTLAALIAVVVFGLLAARFATDAAWNRYEVLFTQSVIGLNRGSPVLYNGVNVGRIAELRLNPDDVREVIATVEINAEVPVHEDTEATIRLLGLTGTAAIQLRGGDPESPLLPTGQRHPARITTGDSPLARLIESSEGIVVTASQVVERLNEILSEENAGHVERTLASAEKLLAGLSDHDGNLNQLLANAARASESLPETVAHLQDASRTFGRVLTGIDQEVIADLPELRAKLDESLTNLSSLTGRIDTIIASNQDALTQIGGVGMRQIDGGLEDLRRLIRDLSDVVNQIEQNPSRFLLGGDEPEEYRPR